MRLIDFEPDHFPILCSWFTSETEVVTWGGPAVTYPLTHRHCADMRAEPNRRCWMVLGDTDQILGHAQLVYDQRNGNALLGRVALAPQSRGRGMAADMLRPLMTKAFSTDWVERLELNVYAVNKAAIRTYEKLGFIVEGVRRSSTIVDGERWDTVIMGLLRSELS